ncbi:hypothetical protein M409DRAFT_50759 [Zasmidium cellare ATCC 36951]|uniref:Zn(2)-C6 fungal-type domain-containing protein n=1 Tax=Zasmidium cellare ATCC 36951 TaxID=1080233 RepID=A0A6A6CYQ5_ZASCE|nr:uncharacterized protein M409DRAFT_50759 [Zasmidium cellare ATCC 36951]KAF2171298.1 hypothetical protein M409DRAFT_50759 [Zasmidium cellare ATCC 36951]
MALETDPAAATQAHVSSDTASQGKLRAACDECRTKKLKCTGERPNCSRCVRENINCIYSPQKQMGRPKKRARTDRDSSPTQNFSDAAIWDPSLHTDGGYDMAPFESAFTPGGSLQPWLKDAGDWGRDFSMPEGGHRHGSENGIPALTPDNSSSSSPPLLNLPPELQSSHASSMTHGHSHGGSTQLLLDPALGGNSSLGMPMGLMPNCACLSTMYLTLNTLQSMDNAFAFPFALHPLREAMQTASEILSCEECPKRFITAIQNTQLLGTLLMSIAERYSKVLEHITAESLRASLAGEEKKFRLQDLNTSTSHLHAGGLGCVAAFSINLSPEEWRSMCKKVVRAEVHGPSEGNDCCCYFSGVIQQMEDRQEQWHKKPAPIDFPVDAKTGKLLGGPRSEMKREDHLCLKLPEYAKKLVQGLDWS